MNRWDIVKKQVGVALILVSIAGCAKKEKYDGRVEGITIVLDSLPAGGLPDQWLSIDLSEENDYTTKFVVGGDTTLVYCTDCVGRPIAANYGENPITEGFMLTVLNDYTASAWVTREDRVGLEFHLRLPDKRFYMRALIFWDD